MNAWEDGVSDIPNALFQDDDFLYRERFSIECNDFTGFN